MNMEAMFSSKSCMWETPRDFFDALNAKYHFDIDVCATGDNAKCPVFFSPEQDGLAQPWGGVCWMNPPYGREIIKWVRKAYESSLCGATIVCLLPARTDTKWFHEYVLPYAEIRFLRGRLKFAGKTEKPNSAPFPSMLAVFSPKESEQTIEQ